MPFLPSPKVNKIELKNHLSKYFSLGKLLSYKKLKKGFANSLYKIKTTKGDFIFKIAVRHNDGNKVQYEIDLLNKIKNLPIPRPIKTKNNKYLFDYKGYKTFIYPYIQGEEKSKYTNQMLFEVGKFLGKLHLQTKGFSSVVKRIEYYDTSSQKLNRVIRNSSGIQDSKIKDTVSYLKRNIPKYKLPANLPKGAMHIDVKPENVLFENGHLSGVVDFDNSYTGPLIFDLADTLMWFCSENKRFNMKSAKIIYNGYLNVRKLSIEEKDALFDALHNVFLAVSLCGVDLLIYKKLPKYFIVWVIDNLLETEKNLTKNKDKFQKIFN